MKRLLRVAITTVVAGLGLVGIIGPTQKADALDTGTLSISVVPSVSSGTGSHFLSHRDWKVGDTDRLRQLHRGWSVHLLSPLVSGQRRLLGTGLIVQPRRRATRCAGGVLRGRALRPDHSVDHNGGQSRLHHDHAEFCGQPGRVWPANRISALVSPVAPGAGPIDEGTVNFSVNGDTFCSEAVSSGTSVCPAEAIFDNVVATFSGDQEILGSSSMPLTTTIPEIATSVQVSPDPSTATFGQMVTYDVGVLTSGGSASGTVGVSIAGVPLCSVFVNDGSASCTDTDAPVGVDTITATFYDESHVFGESTTTSTITVLPQQTSTSAPIVGMASTSSGNGYWLVGSDGAIYSYGDARSFGSLPAMPSMRPSSVWPPPLTVVAIGWSARTRSVQLRRRPVLRPERQPASEQARRRDGRYG